MLALSKWILIGVDEAFKKQAASDGDLADMRRQFAASFDVTSAVKPDVRRWLDNWSKDGSGDRVADITQEVMLRVPVSA